jgi:hypothetical protein
VRSKRAIDRATGQRAADGATGNAEDAMAKHLAADHGAADATGDQAGIARRMTA